MSKSSSSKVLYRLGTIAITKLGSSIRHPLRPEAWETWLTGAVEEALELQSPLPPERLAIVSTNNRADAA
jgi:hypothetical protein